MKNNKLALLPGLSLFVCFCLVTGTGRLASRMGGGALPLALAEGASFLLPLLLLTFGVRDRKALRRRFRLRRLPKGAAGLAVRMGACVAVLSLLLNLAFCRLAGLVGSQLTVGVLDAPQTGLSLAGKLAVVVLLGAVVEELYLRGALMAVQEGIAGTMPCLLVSGAAFAMLHGDLLNFAGPFAAGVAYAYLTYVFDSVWPAVLAHAVSNLYFIWVIWLTETYAAFGIWSYFAPVNALLLLLFVYLTLCAVEKLLIRGDIPHLDRSAGLYDVLLLVRNPGVLVFVLAFAAKAVLRWRLP